MKKILKKIYITVLTKIFIIIYGKITLSQKKIKDVKVTKIFKLDNHDVGKFNYKIYKIENGRVFTNYVENVSIISKNFLLKDVSFQQIDSKLKQNRNETLLNGTPKLQKKIDGSMLVLTQGASGHNNYAHWLLDIIPKIKLASSVYDLKKIDFFLFSKLNNFQKQSLEMMNLNSNKFIDSNLNRHVIVDELLAISHPYFFKNHFFYSQSNVPKWIVKYLRNFFIKKNEKNEVKNSYKIYIDRSDAKTNHCKLINNNELINFLKKKNFKVLKLSQISFKKQISIFKNSKFIIAPHGAGLANIIFCERNTKIIEFFPKNHTNKLYKRISKINNLKYKSLCSKKIKNKDKGDIYIDLKMLKKII